MTESERDLLLHVAKAILDNSQDPDSPFRLTGFYRNKLNELCQRASGQSPVANDTLTTSSYGEFVAKTVERPYGKTGGPAPWDWVEFDRVYCLARASWGSGNPWTAEMTSAEVARRCVGTDLAGSAARVAAFIDAARTYKTEAET